MNLPLQNPPAHCDCHLESIQETVTTEQLSAVMAIFLIVRGMGCPNCALRVRNGAPVGCSRGLVCRGHRTPLAVPVAGGDVRHHRLALTNLWLAALTGNAFPAFYPGDDFGTFN